MSLSVESRRVVYSGNDATTVFAIPFTFQGNSSYVGAKLYTAADETNDENYDDLVITTDYTISGSNLTMITAPATGEKLIIYSLVPLSQGESFANSTPFLPSDMMDGLDKLAQQIQQVNEKASRALKWGQATALDDPELPVAITADATLVANSDGDGLTWGPTVTQLEEWKDDAEAAASNAATSASTASSYASAASSSATDAETAQSAAEAAQAAAEAAQAAAEAIVADGDKGDIVVSSSGTVWTIDSGAVTNAKAADMATQTIKGRTTTGTGSPEDLTATQATAILDAMVGDSGSGGTKGLVPAPATGDAAANKFLKADGTWEAISADHGGLSGLTDDDHTQYALLAGRSGGQTLYGSTVSGQNLTLYSNSVDQSTGRVAVPSALIGYGSANGMTTQGPYHQWDVAGADATTTIPTNSASQRISSAISVRNYSNTNNSYCSLLFGENGGHITSAIHHIIEDFTTHEGRIEVWTAEAGTLSRKVQVAVDGTLTLDSYGAGVLTTDANGVVSASSSGTAVTVSTKTADYTLTNSDDVIIFNATSAAALTLHAVSGATQKPYRVKNIGSADVTLAVSGSDTIDGDTSLVLTAGGAPQAAVTIIPNGGTAWYVF